jgi:hypothetical protein
MQDPNADARRLLAGIIAILLLVAAVVLWIVPGVSTSPGGLMWRAACGRIGVAMVALWMALPSSTRPAAWANINLRSLGAVGLVALALRFPLRFLLPVAIVLMIAVGFLRPRQPVRPPRQVEVDRR